MMKGGVDIMRADDDFPHHVKTPARRNNSEEGISGEGMSLHWLSILEDAAIAARSCQSLYDARHEESFAFSRSSSAKSSLARFFCMGKKKRSKSRSKTKHEDAKRKSPVYIGSGNPLAASLLARSRRRARSPGSRSMNDDRSDTWPRQKIVDDYSQVTKQMTSQKGQNYRSSLSGWGDSGVMDQSSEAGTSFGDEGLMTSSTVGSARTRQDYIAFCQQQQHEISKSDKKPVAAKSSSKRILPTSASTSPLPVVKGKKQRDTIGLSDESGFDHSQDVRKRKISSRESPSTSEEAKQGSASSSPSSFISKQHSNKKSSRSRDLKETIPYPIDANVIDHQPKKSDIQKHQRDLENVENIKPKNKSQKSSEVVMRSKTSGDYYLNAEDGVWKPRKTPRHSTQSEDSLMGNSSHVTADSSVSLSSTSSELRQQVSEELKRQHEMPFIDSQPTTINRGSAINTILEESSAISSNSDSSTPSGGKKVKKDNNKTPLSCKPSNNEQTDYTTTGDVKDGGKSIARSNLAHTFREEIDNLKKLESENHGCLEYHGPGITVVLAANKGHSPIEMDEESEQKIFNFGSKQTFSSTLPSFLRNYKTEPTSKTLSRTFRWQTPAIYKSRQITGSNVTFENITYNYGKPPKSTIKRCLLTIVWSFSKTEIREDSESVVRVARLHLDYDLDQEMETDCKPVVHERKEGLKVTKWLEEKEESNWRREDAINEFQIDDKSASSFSDTGVIMESVRQVCDSFEKNQQDSIKHSFDDDVTSKGVVGKVQEYPGIVRVVPPVQGMDDYLSDHDEAKRLKQTNKSLEIDANKQMPGKDLYNFNKTVIGNKKSTIHVADKRDKFVETLDHLGSNLDSFKSSKQNVSKHEAEESDVQDADVDDDLLDSHDDDCKKNEDDITDHNSYAIEDDVSRNNLMISDDIHDDTHDDVRDDYDHVDDNKMSSRDNNDDYDNQDHYFDQHGDEGIRPLDVPARQDFYDDVGNDDTNIKDLVKGDDDLTLESDQFQSMYTDDKNYFYQARQNEQSGDKMKKDGDKIMDVSPMKDNFSEDKFIDFEERPFATSSPKSDDFFDGYDLLPHRKVDRDASQYPGTFASRQLSPIAKTTLYRYDKDSSIGGRKISSSKSLQDDYQATSEDERYYSPLDQSFYLGSREEVSSIKVCDSSSAEWFSCGQEDVDKQEEQERTTSGDDHVIRPMRLSRPEIIADHMTDHVVDFIEDGYESDTDTLVRGSSEEEDKNQEEGGVKMTIYDAPGVTVDRKFNGVTDVSKPLEVDLLEIYEAPSEPFEYLKHEHKHDDVIPTNSIDTGDSMNRIDKNANKLHAEVEVNAHEESTLQVGYDESRDGTEEPHAEIGEADMKADDPKIDIFERTSIEDKRMPMTSMAVKRSEDVMDVDDDHFEGSVERKYHNEVNKYDDDWSAQMDQTPPTFDENESETLQSPKHLSSWKIYDDQIEINISKVEFPDDTIETIQLMKTTDDDYDDDGDDDDNDDDDDDNDYDEDLMSNINDERSRRSPMHFQDDFIQNSDTSLNSSDELVIIRTFESEDITTEENEKDGLMDLKEDERKNEVVDGNKNDEMSNVFEKANPTQNKRKRKYNYDDYDNDDYYGGDDNYDYYGDDNDDTDIDAHNAGYYDDDSKDNEDDVEQIQSTSTGDDNTPIDESIRGGDGYDYGDYELNEYERKDDPDNDEIKSSEDENEEYDIEEDIERYFRDYGHHPQETSDDLHNSAHKGELHEPEDKLPPDDQQHTTEQEEATSQDGGKTDSDAEETNSKSDASSTSSEESRIFSGFRKLFMDFFKSSSQSHQSDKEKSNSDTENKSNNSMDVFTIFRNSKQNQETVTPKEGPIKTTKDINSESEEEKQFDRQSDEEVNPPISNTLGFAKSTFYEFHMNHRPRSPDENSPHDLKIVKTTQENSNNIVVQVFARNDIILEEVEAQIRKELDMEGDEQEGGIDGEEWSPDMKARQCPTQHAGTGRSSRSTTNDSSNKPGQQRREGFLSPSGRRTLDGRSRSPSGSPNRRNPSADKRRARNRLLAQAEVSPPMETMEENFGFLPNRVTVQITPSKNDQITATLNTVENFYRMIGQELTPDKLAQLSGISSTGTFQVSGFMANHTQMRDQLERVFRTSEHSSMMSDGSSVDREERGQERGQEDRQQGKWVPVYDCTDKDGNAIKLPGMATAEWMTLTDGRGQYSTAGGGRIFARKRKDKNMAGGEEGGSEIGSAEENFVDQFGPETEHMTLTSTRENRMRLIYFLDKTEEASAAATKLVSDVISSPDTSMGSLDGLNEEEPGLTDQIMLIFSSSDLAAGAFGGVGGDPIPEPWDESMPVPSRNYPEDETDIAGVVERNDNGTRTPEMWTTVEGEKSDVASEEDRRAEFGEKRWFSEEGQSLVSRPTREELRKRHKSIEDGISSFDSKINNLNERIQRLRKGSDTNGSFQSAKSQLDSSSLYQFATENIAHSSYASATQQQTSSRGTTSLISNPAEEKGKVSTHQAGFSVAHATSGSSLIGHSTSVDGGRDGFPNGFDPTVTAHEYAEMISVFKYCSIQIRKAFDARRPVKWTDDRPPIMILPPRWVWGGPFVDTSRSFPATKAHSSIVHLSEQRDYSPVAVAIVSDNFYVVATSNMLYSQPGTIAVSVSRRHKSRRKKRPDVAGDDDSLEAENGDDKDNDV